MIKIYFQYSILVFLFACSLWALPAHAQFIGNRPQTNFLTGPTPSLPSSAALPQTPNEETDTQRECQTIPHGQSLFDSGAQRSPGGIMSSKQRVAIGDRLAIATWGAVSEEGHVAVDSQGYIFLKGIGPVYVQGQTEEDLSNHIEDQLEHVFKDGEVQVYARLEQNAGTPVLISGGVIRPGQYYGSAQDSIVTWLQRAGGIHASQGSYRSVRILRQEKTLETIDLYDFLDTGTLKTIIWQPGDVIVVDPPAPQVGVFGDVRRCALYELPRFAAIGADIVQLSSPTAAATHAVIHGIRKQKPYAEVMPLPALRRAALQDGDQIQLYTAQQNEDITIHVEGRTLGNRIFIVPAHTSLSRILDHIPVDPKISDTDSIYVERDSVAKLQKKHWTNLLTAFCKAH